MIGDQVEVRVLEVRGDKVRLGIVAPAEISVHRKEIYLTIQRENRAAAAAQATSLQGALGLLGGAEGRKSRPERQSRMGGIDAKEGPHEPQTRQGPAAEGDDSEGA